MTRIDPRCWSLMLKIPITIILVVVGVAATTGVMIVLQDRMRLRTALEDKALLLTRSVATNAAEAVLRGDYWALYQDLKTVAVRTPAGTDPSIVMTGMVLDANGVVLAHLDPATHPLGLPFSAETPDERGLLAGTLAAENERVFSGGRGDGEFVEGAVPIIVDGKRLGVARVRLSTAELREQTNHAALVVIGVALGLAAIGSLFGTVISRRIVRPLNELARGMETLSDSNPTKIVPVHVVNRDEIGRLAETFNQMSRELAEKKRLEEQLAQSEKLAGLGRIAVGLAHEVNNPLGGMLNCLNTLKKRPNDRILLRRYLDLLETGLRRIERTVKGLLVDLRSSADPVTCGLVCLPDLEHLVTAEVGDRPIRLRWDNELREGFFFTCSCPEIQQVILNLAMNGIQAMPDGGELTIRSRQEGNALIFEVEDCGVGMTEGERRHLFDPFFSGKSKGTGLGLWITYRLVERMAGVIEVESKPGVGSRFRVRLPIEGDRPESQEDSSLLEEAS